MSKPSEHCKTIMAVRLSMLACQVAAGAPVPERERLALLAMWVTEFSPQEREEIISRSFELAHETVSEALTLIQHVMFQAAFDDVRGAT